MKRLLFTFLSILTIGSLFTKAETPGVNTQPMLLQLDEQPTPPDPATPGTITLDTSSPNQTEAPLTTYAWDDDIPDTSEWTVVEGSWFYYSGYTGKSYPTEVKRFNYSNSTTSDYTILVYLKNDLFGSIKIITGNITGGASQMNEYDESGWNPIYPQLKDENGESLGVAFNISRLSSKVSYGNWNCFPLSGNSRFLVAIYNMDEDGNCDYNSGKPYYDYLYNTQAKDCKLNAQYARSYHNGEKTAKIKLNKGAGVTDIYYVVSKQFVDDKRTSADPDWIEGQGYGRYHVALHLLDEYLEEFRAGESNDAYIVGHVSPDATEFEIPLPEKDGLNYLFIVAYSGDQVTDLVYDLIEVRHPYKWSEYGTITIDTKNIKWDRDCEDFNVIECGDYKVEINEEGSYYRIVNPFNKADNPEANYIYLNVPDGRMDRCFIDMSYSPFERTYSFPKPDGTTETLTHPFIISDIIGVNLIKGFYPSDLSDFGDNFIDLGCGKAANHLFMAKDFNTCLLSISSSNYIDLSAYGYINMQFPNYLVTTKTGSGISLEAGPEVDYVVCIFDYDNNDIMTALADNADSFKVQIENGTGFLDLSAMVENNEIPSLPVNIVFTACNTGGESVRTSSLDLTGFALDKEALGSVRFTNCQGNYFTDADLMIAVEHDYKYDRDDFTVKQFGRTMTLPYIDEELTLDFSMYKYNYYYLDHINSIFINYYNVYDYSNCPTYIYFDNIAYNVSPDGGDDTVTGDAYITCHNYYDMSLIGHLSIANITITIPKTLTETNAGIENVTAVEDSLAQPLYYNLQGMRVDNPKPGTLIIEKKGNIVRKIIFQQ